LHEDAGHIRLRVLDDGRGIGAAKGPQPREGFGLRSIRERATALGGHARLTQRGTEGTVLDVVLS
jgi:signal transduction histidine kinase